MAFLWALKRDQRAAVAPTVALALTALIGVGGLAFDYAHMAALDTELQSAADQAALAAATQLDGQTNAIARATAAAQNLVTNYALFADRGQNRTVNIPTLTFYDSYDQVNDTYGNVVTTDAAAKVVKVAVGGRTAYFALTPVVGVFSSGAIGAEAVASLSSAICKEPPVMMCNPATDPSNFDVNNYVGKGFKLSSQAGYVPGNFGFLDVGAGASDLGKLIGYGSLPAKCVDITNPATQPGSPNSVIYDFNTRFDIFESGDSDNCYSKGLCPPSLNSRKDVVLKSGTTPSKQNCGIASGNGSKGWTISNSPYRPTTAAALPTTTTPDAMGYPRDFCHAVSITGTCTGGRIGTGAWDIDAYWRVNHRAGTTNGAVAGLYPTSLNGTIVSASKIAMPSGRTYPTRYMVYLWEMVNAATQLPLAGRNVSGVGTDYGQPVCKPGLTGSTPTSTVPDRRIIPIAVVNCTGLNGAKPIQPLDFVDAFLVEPSVSRSTTSFGDIYVEILGHTGNGTGGTSPQVVRRDKPYLIR